MAHNTSNTMLAGVYCTDNIHLVVGTNPLAAARCTTSLAAGARPVLVAPAGADLHYNLQTKIEQGLIRWHQKAFEDEHLFTLGRDEVGRTVDAVFVTSAPREALAARISSVCRRNRIPVNVVDAPHLSTFGLLPPHAGGPLQIGVAPNGRGCKLASRVRREIASCLPPGLGAACDRLGELRRRIQHDDALAPGDLDDALDQGSQFNRLVGDDEARTRRMRWLGQLLLAYPGHSSSPPPPPPAQLDAAAAASSPRGRIVLAGSGPGDPSLLTTATLRAIQTADVVLADKLVPSGVLDLIPRRTPVQIARKFPGNADQAQEELLETALAAVRSGQAGVGPQGDPFVYGRGGEEVAFFRARGLGDRVTSVFIIKTPGVKGGLHSYFEK
ncbi:siroheme synthase, putative [Metarhizium acridum CQMa 102]|uniref:precorrin-2 dehydrogenase n=1 Tax=Metarhizium acridum (strain CQMa 102) TaxID=655827 RepID=E9E892_METAQ|nr:siroheme synthase, putative [Metarhizium acridum CQMa 102]EFY87842.1 siroheme synthase, putative [Metarhizium acridum CQMa 102]